MISNIRLQQFRSYLDQSFEFTPGVNIIVGANASGKTNLLEGILYSCQGKSYRSKDAGLMNYDQEWTALESFINDYQQRIVINKQGEKIQKKITIDNKKFFRFPTTHKTPIVLFEPENLRILTGSPDLRREFLDDLLEQTIPGFYAVIRDFRRILSQRNALLKKINVYDEEFFAWNVRLVNLAERIHNERIQLIKELNDKISEVYSAVSNTQNKVKIKYQTTSNTEQYASHLLKALENNISLDKQRGFTAIGPHRDDLEFMINNQPAQATASRGETRTLVIALKIIELEIKKSSSKNQPIVLLDDVFSELDGSRRLALTGHLKKTQTFITTTDADIVSHKFVESSNIILLEKKQ